ncbi:MFS transporter [Oceanobacillus sp. FSL H7-0719]|uniref:MFS transporter n=1 Tax=Oceanobacillus sp. FSL H7-0719 TaxID=2954507 RepID=UPI003251CBA9
MQLPGGWLADKFGPRKVLLASVVAWSIFTGLTGAAFSLASMVIIRSMLGIGEGGFQPASSKIISQTFPVKERGRAMSVMLSSSGIITLIIPFLSAALLTTIGWRWIFLMMGLIGAVITILYWIYIKFPEEDIAVIEKRNTKTGGKGMMGQLLRTPMIWNLVIAYFCIYAVNWGLVTWIPTYLVQVRGLDLLEIGWAQTVPGCRYFLCRRDC